MRYVSVPHAGNASRVRWYPFCPVLSVGKFWTCSKLRMDATRYIYELWVNVTHALVCGLYGSRAVCPVLMRSASCRYPVCIRWCPFDRSCERSTARQVKECPGRVRQVHSVIVQPTFCPFLIRYIFVLSIIHLLHARLLTVLCPLLVLYIFSPYNFRDDLHRHWDDFHHWIKLFLHFSVC